MTLVVTSMLSSTAQTAHVVHAIVDATRLQFFFEAEDGIRDWSVTGVQTCALYISSRRRHTRLVSDWSSDVCSSDLTRLIAVIKRAEPTKLAASTAIAYGDQACRGAPCIACGFTSANASGEIGRASCRERV